MMDGATCIGFVGFDPVRQPMCFSEDEQRLLSVFAGFLANIHRRQQAEGTLNQTVANMQAIIENTLDSIWAINTNYEILYANEVFARDFDAIFGVVLTPGVNILQPLRVKERTVQLEEANRELEAFSYSVLHDLRAPLRAIDGFSRIFVDEYSGQIPEDGRSLLNQVRASANRMGALIDDLLKFSRLLSNIPANVQMPALKLAVSLMMWKQRFITSRTMVLALICAMPASCLVFSSVCTARASLKAQGWDWRLFTRSSPGMAGTFGLNQHQTRVQHFISRSARGRILPGEPGNNPAEKRT